MAVGLALAGPQAFTEEAAPVAGSDEPLAEIMVFGRGETRQVSTVTADDIARYVPGTSPLAVIEKMPGVSFQSADSYGAYEWSTRISIRGFNQNQLGFTLDGVPLGDMSYGNHNGLHISRAILAENIGNVKLSQGAGTLETATSSNLGGTLQFFSMDPAHEFGVNVQLTGGSYSDRRGFVRFESGDLGAAGTRMYLAYANQNSDKWKGSGEQKQEGVNFKIVQPIGDAKLTGFFDWSNRQENDYQDMSLDMLNRLGYNWDNISDNWPLMVQVASIFDAGGQAYPGGPYPAPILTPDDAYANAAGLRKDKLAGLTLNLPVSEAVSWDTTAYLHKNNGQGIWFTPYVPTPVGAPDGAGGTISAPAPISVRTTEYDIDRKGVTTGLSWNFGAHTVNGGIWYEDNDFNQARRFYGLELAAPQRDSLEFMRDPFFTQWEYAFNTKTTQYFLQDTWAINDALKVNFGFKSLDVKNKARAIVDTRFTTSLAGDIEAKKSFLPQVGVNWTVNGQSEIFGDVTRNMRAFIAAATGPSPFATSPDNFQALKASGGLEPETSTTVEAGWRYNTGRLHTVATVYYVDFKDRLLANTIGAGIVGNPVVLQNVGGVETKGAEIGALWSFRSDWSWYNSLSYNDSKYKDDVVSVTIDPISGNPVTTITPTKGKTIVDAPKALLRSELSYDNSRWFGKLGVNYTGKRYFTYLNDQNAGAYT
ncbi:MAG: TonB-dependent receptor, partial [Steroidobacteraceae bacterium]